MGLVKEHTSPQGAGAPYKAIGGEEGKWVGHGKCGLGFPLPSLFSLEAHVGPVTPGGFR